MGLLLGIDLGTSSVKAVLFDPDTSTTLATSGQEYAIYKPTPDRAEQNPEEWWQTTVAVVRHVVASSTRHDIAAISFSGHMHGVTLLDRAGKPVRPAIIWADQRTSREVDELVATVGADAYSQHCGTLPAAGFTAPTMLWLAKHEPETLAYAQHMLFVKDYVRYRMTGVVGAEVSDAAGSGMFNVAQRVWAYEVTQAARIPEYLLPPVHNSTTIAGELLPAAAEPMGIQAGIPVVMGAADQPAQAVGNGIITPGIASITVGSGGQVFVPILPASDGRLPTDARLHVFNHAVPNAYYVLGALLSAGLSLRWLRNLLGMAAMPDAYAILSQEAAATSPGANGLLFLPYLTGERTPHMDAQARGAFIGLTAAHERGHLARAVMEGVSFALRQVLEISLSLGGRAERVIGAGGAMESPVWRGILTDILGLPIQRPMLTEQAGIGAALIAGVGIGQYSSFEEACQRVVRYSEPTQPNIELQSLYDERYTNFIEMYPRLRADFHRLSGSSFYGL
jgi:xylulokinase